jgi:heme exporter protein CcmD
LTLETPHLGFIVAAYTVAAVALIGMIVAVWLDYRSLSNQIEALEKGRGGNS